MNDTATRSLHTLWQAAGGFAATSVVVQDFANGDSHDARIALLTAGTAVSGAVLSLAKAQAVRSVAALNAWLKARKVPVQISEASLQAIATAAVQKALADAKASDSVRQDVTDAARTAVDTASTHTPYSAS